MLEFVDSDLYFVQDKNNFINPLLQVGSGSGGPKNAGSRSSSLPRTVVEVRFKLDLCTPILVVNVPDGEVMVNHEPLQQLDETSLQVTGSNTQGLKLSFQGYILSILFHTNILSSMTTKETLCLPSSFTGCIYQAMVIILDGISEHVTHVC